MTATRRMTAAEFAALDLGPGRCDVIDGEIICMAAAGGQHGLIAARCVRWLGTAADAGGLGEIFTAETGFVLAEGVYVCPDVAFVRRERMPSGAALEGILGFPPDLAVEIVSPSDRAGLVEVKVAKYLGAGTPVLWVIYPRERLVVVHAPGQPPRTCRVGDQLDGGDVLPGLRISIADLFR